MEGCRGLEKESAGWASSGGRPADAKMEPSGWAASGGIPADAKTSGGRKKRPADAKMSGGRKIVRPADAKTSGGRRNARPADAKNVRRTQKRSSGGRPADAYSGGRKFQRTQNPADRVHRAECGHPVEVGRRSTRCRIGMLLGYLCRVHGEIQWKHLVERHQTALEKWKLGKVYIQGPSRDETCTELYVGSASTLNAIN